MSENLYTCGLQPRGMEHRRPSLKVADSFDSNESCHSLTPVCECLERNVRLPHAAHRRPSSMADEPIVALARATTQVWRYGRLRMWPLTARTSAGVAVVAGGDYLSGGENLVIGGSREPNAILILRVIRI